MGYLSHKPTPHSKIVELMNMDPDQKIRVYTRQANEAWVEAQHRGYLTGSHGKEDPEVNGGFEYPYEWMRNQMAQRIPDFSGDLPVWAWTKRQNERKYVSAWSAKDRPLIPIQPRIIALVPRKRVLLSCFDLWHCHLNNWNISFSPDEDLAYETRWPKYKAPGSDPVYQQDTETNWSTVFDIHLPRAPYLIENHGTISVIQACVDRIYLNEVINVRWADPQAFQSEPK